MLLGEKLLEVATRLFLVFQEATVQLLARPWANWWAHRWAHACHPHLSAPLSPVVDQRVGVVSRAMGVEDRATAVSREGLAARAARAEGSVGGAVRRVELAGRAGG